MRGHAWKQMRFTSPSLSHSRRSCEGSRVTLYSNIMAGQDKMADSLNFHPDSFIVSTLNPLWTLIKILFSACLVLSDSRRCRFQNVATPKWAFDPVLDYTIQAGHESQLVSKAGLSLVCEFALYFECNYPYRCPFTSCFSTFSQFKITEEIKIAFLSVKFGIIIWSHGMCFMALDGPGKASRNNASKSHAVLMYTWTSHGQQLDQGLLIIAVGNIVPYFRGILTESEPPLQWQTRSPHNTLLNTDSCGSMHCCKHSCQSFGAVL